MGSWQLFTAASDHSIKNLKINEENEGNVKPVELPVFLANLGQRVEKQHAAVQAQIRTQRTELETMINRLAETQKDALAERQDIDLIKKDIKEINSTLQVLA
jgi:hypothetical protein